MRRLTALAAAAILALTACMEPTEGPADKPTHEASGRWQEWFGDHPGITLLDEEPRLSGHSGPQAVVRANDAQAVESLVEALEQLPDEGLAVTIVVDIDGTRSELRHLPHHTLAESVEALLAPMPKGVRLRAVGYPTEHWMVDEGLLPAEAALDIRYFADDILPVAPELTAPDDHTVSVSDGDFGDSGDEVQQLGGNVEERHWKTTFPEFRALAEGLDAAMSLESPPTAVDYDVIRFQHRASAITAAQQLEDTPLTISTMRGDGSLYLYPQQHWETTAPTRDELIASANEHEEVWVGTIDGVRLKYTDPDACAGFLHDMPTGMPPSRWSARPEAVASSSFGRPWLHFPSYSGISSRLSGTAGEEFTGTRTPRRARSGKGGRSRVADPGPTSARLERRGPTIAYRGIDRPR
ncbi:hypothetical protein [uncultured Tessaracoccus sp.]|uniref:hypothetical protein n=1 Tax=uncultured Tessaracoccus sp. TaxID=905023 RepID=UPI0026287EB2|nr:hypothetical protein [uncultured Tessaracoccus sp.]